MRFQTFHPANKKKIIANIKKAVEKPLDSYILPKYVEEMERNSNPLIMILISVCHQICFVHPLFASLFLQTSMSILAASGVGAPKSAEGVF